MAGGTAERMMDVGGEVDVKRLFLCTLRSGEVRTLLDSVFLCDGCYHLVVSVLREYTRCGYSR